MTNSQYSTCQFDHHQRKLKRRNIQADGVRFVWTAWNKASPIDEGLTSGCVPGNSRVCVCVPKYNIVYHDGFPERRQISLKYYVPYYFVYAREKDLWFLFLAKKEKRGSFQPQPQHFEAKVKHQVLVIAGWNLIYAFYYLYFYYIRLCARREEEVLPLLLPSSLHRINKRKTFAPSICREDHLNRRNCSPAQHTDGNQQRELHACTKKRASEIEEKIHVEFDLFLGVIKY